MSAASRCAACLERRRLRRKAWAHNRRARELSTDPDTIIKEPRP